MLYMKKYLKFILVPLLLVFVISSCKKDEHKIFLEGGTAPVLKASVTDTIPLIFADKDKEAVNLTWTNPNYKFTTGISSHSVSYQIEIDTAGANFTNPQKQTVSISSDLSKSFTQEVFNDYLLNQLVLKPAVPHNIEIRVKSFLENNSGLLFSNALAFTVTPYAIPPKVDTPYTGHLYIVGNATPGGDATGWNNPVPVPTQEFERVSSTLYQITIPLIGGKEYLFLPKNGDWGHKYAVADKTVAGLSSGGDFKYDAKDNFPGPASSGTYKIVVDFQRGKFTVTPQ